jgi:hypothetical protein
VDLISVLGQHWTLASVLLEKRNVAKNMIELLKVGHLAAPVLAKTIQFIEQLLAFQTEHQPAQLFFDEEDVSKLLDYLHLLLSKRSQYWRNRDYFLKKELALLDSVTPYAKSASQAFKLLELLKPHVKNEKIDEEPRRHILGIFKNCFPLLDQFAPLVPIVSSLLGTMKERESRIVLSATFEELGKHYPPIGRVVLLISSSPSCF